MIDVRGVNLNNVSEFFTIAPEAARRAARLAVNDVARDEVTEGRKDILEEILFPRGYLTDERIGITRFATEERPEAVISARDRATSLARFAINTTPGRSPRVRLKPGSSKAMNRAFLIRLRAGQGPVTDESFNLGMAIRLGPGERIQHKREMAFVPIGRGLYLLYGPSVAQVYRAVSLDHEGPLSVKLESEFLRQFERLTR